MKALIKKINSTTFGYELVLHINKTKSIEKLTAGSTIDIEIEQLKEKRSLSQNAYCWVLISKIAEIVNTSKEEVYMECLRNYGQSMLIKIRNREKERFERTQKYFEVEKQDEHFTYFKVYAGSSLYNKEEMKLFLDGVISEAEQLGIVTMTPQEVERLNIQ